MSTGSDRLIVKLVFEKRLNEFVNRENLFCFSIPDNGESSEEELVKKLLPLFVAELGEATCFRKKVAQIK